MFHVEHSLVPCERCHEKRRFFLLCKNGADKITQIVHGVVMLLQGYVPACLFVPLIQGEFPDAVLAACVNPDPAGFQSVADPADAAEHVIFRRNHPESAVAADALHKAGCGGIDYNTVNGSAAA